MSIRETSKLPLAVKALYGNRPVRRQRQQHGARHLPAVLPDGGLRPLRLAYPAPRSSSRSRSMPSSIPSSARCRTTPNRAGAAAHLYMFASFPMMFVGLGMLFTVPMGLAGIPLFIYVTAMALLMRIGLSAYVVPYIALGAELSDDYIERSRVIAWRSFFSVPATIVPVVLGYGVFLAARTACSTAPPMYPSAGAAPAILCVFGALAAFGTLGSIDRLHRTVPSGDHTPAPPGARGARGLPQPLLPHPVLHRADLLRRARHRRRAQPARQQVLLEPAGRRDPVPLHRRCARPARRHSDRGAARAACRKAHHDAVEPRLYRRRPGRHAAAAHRRRAAAERPAADDAARGQQRAGLRRRDGPRHQLPVDDGGRRRRARTPVRRPPRGPLFLRHDLLGQGGQRHRQLPRRRRA